MRRKYQVVLLTLLACGLLIAPLAARAGTQDGTELQAELCSNSTCTTPVNDIGSPGILTFGPLGIGVWNVNSGTGTGSDGTGGGLMLPDFMDLSSFDATSSGGGTGANKLTLELTITGLTGPITNLSALNTIGGTNSSNGSVTVTSQAFISTTNSAFCITGCSSLTSLISNTTVGHAQLFGGSGSGTFVGSTGNPYSLTLIITISSALADNSSFDSELSQIPEPATLSVLGAGLLALGTGLRKKLLRS